MKDERTLGCSRKGYFTVGYDTQDDSDSPLPGQYDFFVRFKNKNSSTSPYYLKPNVIIFGLKGCKKNVNFIYKDPDVVMKKDIEYAFRERRISYQEEMYNESANAGIILGKKSAKVKNILQLWSAGVNIATNVEQDQTVLRSLVSEYPASFERLAKNSVGTHVYSSAKNREWNIAKFEMKQWCIFRIVYNALSFYAIYATIIAIGNHRFISLIAKMLLKTSFGPHRRKQIWSNSYLTNKLGRRFNEIFFFVHVGLLIKVLLGNPLFVAKSIGKHTLNDAYRYHLGDHFLADDLTRIHYGGKGAIFMSDTRNSYEIYNLLGIPEAFIITTADTLYMAMNLIPLSNFAVCMWVIFLSTKYKLI